jgi:hypothetical protein
MDINQIRNIILANKKPSYQTTNRKEVRVRCPYCGDSKKDKMHAHLYIEMTPPFKFYCQKCTTAGVLNTQTLRDLGIFNSDLNVSIIEANKIIKVGNNQKTFVNKKNPVLNKVENMNSENAVNYFNARYGTNFDNDYIVDKFKTITNPLQFFADNYIRIPINNFGQPLYDFANSIGFLSSDGSHVIFRDITGKQQKRYFNLDLSGGEISTSSKLYNIKSSVDILQDEITLVLTEGIFDIIGVYQNFYKDKVDESKFIFAAAAGKGYNAVISHYIRMGFLNLNVIIYSDSDVDTYFFKDMKANSVYLKNSPLTIYYNTLEKDFGVRSEKIKIRRVVI